MQLPSKLKGLTCAICGLGFIVAGIDSAGQWQSMSEPVREALGLDLIPVPRQNSIRPHGISVCLPFTSPAIDEIH